VEVGLDSGLVPREFALGPIGPVSIEDTPAQDRLKLSSRTSWRRVWPAWGWPPTLPTASGP